MPDQERKRILLDVRPVVPEDRDFLLRVYEAAREIELSMVPWDAATKRAFVEHQFDAQLMHYSTEYPDARHDVIILSETGAQTGRLYVNRTAELIAILDITVLPEFRRRGIGSAMVDTLIEEAHDSGQSVQVYVETFNPSQQFFISRGFVIENDDGFNLKLVRRAEIKSDR
jgi:ribosomal protein S18 acetylase RimI-like enzyme